MWKIGSRLPGNSRPCQKFEALKDVYEGYTVLQVLPAFVLTKMLLESLLATPTNMRGVAAPLVPEVESNVTQAIPED